MTRLLLIVTICIAISGCVVFPPQMEVRTQTASSAAKVEASEVAALVPGSQVEIHCEWGTSSSLTLGTVLHASTDGVALMNCKRSGRSAPPKPLIAKLPYFDRLYKNSGVGIELIPVEWISTRKMTFLRVAEPAPPDFVAPQLDINTNDQPCYERIGIDFSFGCPPTPSKSE